MERFSQEGRGFCHCPACRWKAIPKTATLLSLFFIGVATTGLGLRDRSGRTKLLIAMSISPPKRGMTISDFAGQHENRDCFAPLGIKSLAARN
jgi:hypothetical protein